jgi:hypothetical protein
VSEQTIIVTNDPFFWIRMEDAGLRMFGGTRPECDCIAELMGDGGVVMRADLLDALRESGTKIEEVDKQFWPSRKELCDAR